MKWLLLVACLALAAFATVLIPRAVLPVPATRRPTGLLAQLPRLAIIVVAAICLAATLEVLNLTLSQFHISRLQTLVNFCVAGVLATVLHLMLRFRASLWLFLPVLMLSMVPQFEPAWASYWHGFMHSSVVYEIVQRGSPPENPLMAGTPLLYPYGHHLLIAWLMHAVPLSPPQAFVLTDILTLLLFAILIERTAFIISADRAFRVFAVLFAVCGPTPFAHTPFLDLLNYNGLGLNIEWRYGPLEKFVGINNNQVGLVFIALALWALVSLAAGARRQWLMYGWTAFAIIASGLIYPASWLGIAACAGSIALYFVVIRKQELRSTGIILGVVTILSSAAVLPFLLSISVGKAGDSAFALNLSPSRLFGNAVDLAALAALIVPLMWLCRTELKKSYRQQPLVYSVLSIMMLVSIVMYLAITGPDHAEYKFLHVGVLAVSFPAAMALRELYERRRAIALVTLLVVSLPFASPFTQWVLHEQISDPVVSEGRTLRHADPAQDELHQWILQRTPPDSVFVDSYLTIPPLTGRPLLVGLDMRRDSGALTGPNGTIHDGWMVSADEFLRKNTGVDVVRHHTLRNAAVGVLKPQADADFARDIRILSDASPDRPLFIVARDNGARARLAGIAGLRLVYNGQAAGVFAVRP